ncbi:MAG TPA: UxaA family hydrolase [Gaiellaceae bacterium]|nr:UxaA family hydrolase [Gaiellaceae bacterium]
MHKALAHNRGDDVAVAVAEIAPDEEIVVVYMDDDGEERLRAKAAVPYGHKVALRDVAADAPVIEYSTQVGVAISSIGAGDYVHTHNIKTARW